MKFVHSHDLSYHDFLLKYSSVKLVKVLPRRGYGSPTNYSLKAFTNYHVNNSFPISPHKQCCANRKDDSSHVQPVSISAALRKMELVGPFTKPPILQESRLTGGSSPNLVVLVEWKIPVEGFMGAANCFH